MKPVRVILSTEASEAYSKLVRDARTSKQARSLLKAIQDKIALIKLNHHYGEPLAKKLIPKEFVRKYGTTNLFRVELPGFWRMLYMLTDDELEIEIIAFILTISDHPTYDKLLGYRKK